MGYLNINPCIQTDATINQVSNALASLHLRGDGVANYNFETVKNSLIGKSPIFIAALPSTGGSIGHAWIIDGCMTRSRTWTEYEDMYDSCTDKILYTTPMGSGTQQSTYLHFNWGWDGNHNGYFEDGLFKPSAGVHYDEGVVQTGNNTLYSVNIKIIKNLRSL